jgi:uncharacterized protein (TIGR02145 family)
VINGNPIPLTAISNTDFVPKFVTYTITPSISGCPGTPFTTYQVQVNPSPTVINFPLEQEICSGDASELVELAANVDPTTYTWTATPSSADITGFQVTPGTGNIPVQTISNASNTQRGFVNYHIIPSSQSGMTCPGAPADYKIYVNPLPNPVISGPTQVCYDQSGSVYQNSTNLTSHDYLWTVTGAVSFTGNPTYSITVDWGPGPSGTVLMTETDQSHSTSCSATTPVKNIIINPAPYPSITSNQPSPCGNTSVTYTLGGAQANHSYLWSVTGGTPLSGTNYNITVSWGNSNPVSVSVVESITYAPGVVCSSPVTSLPVSLNLIPDGAGTIFGPTESCRTLSRNFTIPPINNSDSYTWWYDPPADVSITNNGTSSVFVTFGPAALSGNLYVKGNKTGCASGLSSPAHHVTVHALPFVSLSACNDPSTTTSSKSFALKGGIPDGGQYYINGVLSATGIFNPMMLTPGSYQITYSYTDVNTCVNTTSAVPINVVAGSNLLTCPPTFKDRRDQQQYSALSIGGRCWMVTNLNYSNPMLSDLQPQSDNCVPEKYCPANDATCAVSGGFYQWDELMQYQVPSAGQTVQGLCPPEWHVPTSAEWQALIDVVASMSPGDGVGGDYLEYTNGFHALTNGTFYQNSTWSFTSGSPAASMFWTSTLSGGKPVARGLNSINPSVSVYESSKANAFPVRCVKD